MECEQKWRAALSCLVVQEIPDHGSDSRRLCPDPVPKDVVEDSPAKPYLTGFQHQDNRRLRPFDERSDSMQLPDFDPLIHDF